MTGLFLRAFHRYADHHAPARGGGHGNRLALVARFLRDCWRARLHVLHWLRHRDAAGRARIKAALGLSDTVLSAPLNRGILAPATCQAPPPQATATIIIPVFNAFDILPRTLSNVLAHSDLPWRMIVVEDCSTDPRVRPWLRAWKAGLPPQVAQRITLIENDENIGLVGAANRALSLAIPLGDHVVLLNSDTLVPPRWLGRILAPIVAQADVASVTPMSNNAEILSIPAICRNAPLHPGEAGKIDRIASRLPADVALADVPTAVGFCMALNIAWLRKLPAFDPVFGQGYGEEVDWCQRIRALGGRHLATAGLFVEHQGAASFGAQARARKVHDSSAVLRRRYPRFDRDVQAFIRNDPLRTARLVLALVWVAARHDGPVPIYLAHSMGGGAEHVLQRQITKDLPRGGAVVLRVGGSTRWRLEVHTATGVTYGECEDTALIHAMISHIPQRRLVYSCGVGDPDPIELPRILLSLANRPQDRIEVLVHDYLMISPSWTLLDADGHYRGLPMPGTTSDRAHSVIRPTGDCTDLATWQAAWGALLQAASRITVFSNSSHALLMAAYPMVTAQVTVAPHNLPVPIPAIARPAPSRRCPVIGVLGNIGHQKGAKVLQLLSHHLARSHRARLVVIGNMDPAFPLARAARIHGHYQPAEITTLARRYRIDRWFIPSIWPETFSFTTHEALATGLPVFCFDVGAQGAAVRAAHAQTGTGGTIPLPRGHPDMDALLDAILSDDPAPPLSDGPAPTPTYAARRVDSAKAVA